MREGGLKQKNNNYCYHSRETFDSRAFNWPMVFPSSLFVSGDRCDFHSSPADLIFSRPWYCFDRPRIKARHREISISVHGDRHTSDDIGEKVEKL